MQLIPVTPREVCVGTRNADGCGLSRMQPSKAKAELKFNLKVQIIINIGKFDLKSWDS